MTEIIGNAAGQIWAFLAEQDTPVNVADIPKLTKVKTQIAYQALGWLAREGKLDYQKDSQKTYVCLAHNECFC